MAKAKEPSFQEQLNKIDVDIDKMVSKRKEIAKLALKEIGATVEMPLHQLNKIASVGYEKAKKFYGDNWVE